MSLSCKEIASGVLLCKWNYKCIKKHIYDSLLNGVFNSFCLFSPLPPFVSLTENIWQCLSVDMIFFDVYTCLYTFMFMNGMWLCLCLYVCSEVSMITYINVMCVKNIFDVSGYMEVLSNQNYHSFIFYLKCKLE